MKKHVSVIILGTIALACIAGLILLAYAPAPQTETQFIQNSLYGLAGVAVGAIAGIVRPVSSDV